MIFDEAKSIDTDTTNKKNKRKKRGIPKGTTASSQESLSLDSKVKIASQQAAEIAHNKWGLVYNNRLSKEEVPGKTSSMELDGVIFRHPDDESFVLLGTEAKYQGDNNGNANDRYFRIKVVVDHISPLATMLLFFSSKGKGTKKLRKTSMEVFGAEGTPANDSSLNDIHVGKTSIYFVDDKITIDTIRDIILKALALVNEKKDSLLRLNSERRIQNEAIRLQKIA